MKRLSGEEWATHQQAAPPDDWTIPVFGETQPGDVCLEMGVGTGLQSVRLANDGRIVAGFDSSDEIIGRIQLRNPDVFLSLKVADITQPFPYKDKTFDCVWSSGLLEHFTDEELAPIMAESVRVARKKVISLVPNANCKAYMDWKAYKEQTNTWEYGLELPRYTMEHLFLNAGLKNIREYSVGDLFESEGQRYLLVTVGDL